MDTKSPLQTGLPFWFRPRRRARPAVTFPLGTVVDEVAGRVIRAVARGPPRAVVASRALPPVASSSPVTPLVTLWAAGPLPLAPLEDASHEEDVFPEALVDVASFAADP